MEQFLYGDVLFFVNFSMDYLTLFVTAKLLRRKLSYLRLAAAAAIGAIYGVAACFFEFALIFQIAINIVIAVLICMISFGRRKLMPCCALFYGSGCFLGGVMTAIFSMMNSISGTQTVFVDGSYRTVSGEIPLGWTAVVAVITAITAVLGGQYKNRKQQLPEAEISVFLGEKEIKFNGIFDSGNLLTEPMTNKPVIIMNEKTFFCCIPTVLQAFYADDDITKLSELPSQYIKTVKLIPSESIGGSRMLKGFVPDKITVNGIERDVIIALCKEISEFGGNEALVPSIFSD